MPPTYNLPNIRALLTEGFSETELRDFCFDAPGFRPVHHELTQLTGSAATARHLLEFAERKELLDALLAFAAQQNPAKYQKHRPYANDDKVSNPAEIVEARARYIELIIDRHQDLDFVGIPELKDRQALHLDEVFINLQADVDVVVESSELIETVMQDEQVTIRHMRASASIPRGVIKRRVLVNEALREYQRLVILGDPGAGKTTLLKYITLAFAQDHSDQLGLPDEDRLPIFVRLYDYVAKRAGRPEDYSLLDYLYTQAHENLLLDLPAGFFEAELAQGKCCVCLDGLDELGAAGLRREVSAAVASLASRYPRNRYLVASRLVGYEEAPLDRRDFVHHTVLPFGDDDIRRFVQQWYAAREKDPVTAQRQTKHLIETIMKELRLKELAANPLLLTIIALVHRIEAELPHERVKLYDKCVTAMVETWEQVKRLSVEDRERPYYQKRRQLLEQLAFWLHTQPLEGTTDRGRAREIAEGDLRVQITRFLREDPQLKLDKRSAGQEGKDFITMIKARTGLLIERGEGVYSFAHLTFQEYLAAAYIEYEHADSIDDIWAVIQPHLHDPAWREVILLLLGSLNKFRKHPTALVRRIFESTDEYEDLLHRHLYLANRALADRVQVDTALHDAIVNKLLGLARSDEFGHYDALIALATQPGNDRIAGGLLALAHDRAIDANVRRDAAFTLGQLGQVDQAAMLLLALTRDSSVRAEVKGASVVTLSLLGQTEEVAGLLLALAYNRGVSASVTSTVAELLGQLGRTDQAILAVMLTLAGDQIVDARVRHATATAIGRLGYTEEAAVLLLTLARDSEVTGDVRRAATKTLIQLDQANEFILTSLLALARDSTVNNEIRLDATTALGQLGRADQAADLLLTLAFDSTSAPWVRRDAAGALGQLGWANQAILIGLSALARDNTMDDEMRCEAAAALGKLGHGDEAVDLLLALACDSAVDNEIRLNAAVVLEQLGRADQAANLLLALAHDSAMTAWVRRAAATTLSQLGWVEEATDLLVSLACNSAVEAWVRSDAAIALGHLGRADEAVDILLTLIRTPTLSDWMRRDVAQVLGQLGRADEAAALLLALACDERVDAFLRRDVVEALGQLGQTDTAILSDLLALARNEDEVGYVRSAAYRSLKALLGGEPLTQ